jgi:arylformamidase
MKIYDISQEVFSSEIYEGDPAPHREVLMDMNEGALYNLSAFSMCVHNGTHIDAPSHFINDAKHINELDLKKVIGYAYVCEHNGDFNSEDATRVIKTAEKYGIFAEKRLLLKGDCVITENGALALAKSQISLIGVESQSAGPLNAPMEVHKILLSHDAVLLEGLRLLDVTPGVYFLFAAPLNLGGSEGAPVRAVLLEGV